MRTLSEYTANDVAIEDQPAYAKHVDQWQTELHPNGALECYFAAEIVRATWRIQRYAIFPAPDMTDQARATWLRYRDQTNLGIRRNLEELRRLQSDRYLQAHLSKSCYPDSRASNSSSPASNSRRGRPIRKTNPRNRTLPT